MNEIGEMNNFVFLPINMFDSKVGFPILFKGIDTNLTIIGHVWMENFCHKES